MKFAVYFHNPLTKINASFFHNRFLNSPTPEIIWRISQFFSPRPFYEFCSFFPQGQEIRYFFPVADCPDSQYFYVSVWWNSQIFFCNSLRKLIIFFYSHLVKFVIFFCGWLMKLTIYFHNPLAELGIFYMIAWRISKFFSRGHLKNFMLFPLWHYLTNAVIFFTETIWWILLFSLKPFDKIS